MPEDQETAYVSQVSATLVERFDRQLAWAIRDVEKGEIQKGNVTLSIDVAKDDRGTPFCKFTFKHTETESGTFEANRQARIPNLID